MTVRSVKAWQIAAESYDLAVGPLVRPSTRQWLRYAFWGRLPAENAVWVLWDTTCSTWVVRHVSRLLTAAVLPVLALALLLPAGIGVRVLTAVVTGMCAVLLPTMYVNESTAHRLSQAGYEWRIGPAVRAKRDEVSQFLHNW